MQQSTENEATYCHFYMFSNFSWITYVCKQIPYKETQNIHIPNLHRNVQNVALSIYVQIYTKRSISIVDSV